MITKEKWRIEKKLEMMELTSQYVGKEAGMGPDGVKIVK